jgi:hypothetical protein
MKQIQDERNLLIDIGLIDLKHPVAGSIIVNTSRECVLSCVFVVKSSTRSTQIMTQGYSVRIFYFGIPYFLCSSNDIFDKWNKNNSRSTSCSCPGHILEMMFLLSSEAEV